MRAALTSGVRLARTVAPRHMTPTVALTRSCSGDAHDHHDHASTSAAPAATSKVNLAKNALRHSTVLRQKAAEPATSAAAAAGNAARASDNPALAAINAYPAVMDTSKPVHHVSQRLQTIMAHNHTFVETKGYLNPSAMEPSTNGTRCVVVTCMDARLTHLLEAATGLAPGMAKKIKTAGAIVSHPFGGIMRSIIVALYELNADEVFVIGHHDCGMNNSEWRHRRARRAAGAGQ